ncbi:hypothetical protein DFH94DRAFT_687466 [Russula ochroleuca]|uniref:Uncharacterized protein n=1 Tax=Russula ochroleuca TaxID=152965 RepID=A0A9P5N5U4_9AGAM|nr:hypothetical protein DFH94DRAFT_687466 [Russula ochroleuca]
MPSPPTPPPLLLLAVSALPPTHCIDAPWILHTVLTHLAPACHVDAPSPSACPLLASTPSLPMPLPLLLLAASTLPPARCIIAPPARCADTTPFSLH